MFNVKVKLILYRCINIICESIMHHTCRRRWLEKAKDYKGLWFHIIGLACLIWFTFRVLPAPHRSQYPCQQVSIPIALTYIAFWSGLFHGLSIWLRRVKYKTSAAVPALLVALIVLFSVSGAVFGINLINTPQTAQLWDPIPKEPMGVPTGLYPGRVTWVWNPGATEENLDGYWWEEQNNNLPVIKSMFSDGIQALAGETTDFDAWDQIFRYFNLEHGKGDVGYEPGEKIAIKINLNNHWISAPYNQEDNDRDASPYVVKALLRQLIDVVGVEQEDITVYDASRRMPDWFYYRTYYEEYEGVPDPIPEFPDVHFVDVHGDAEGREQVIASSEKIYFADGLERTLPTCVVEAEYLINMPLLKRHPINFGVTLSGKNMFGTWIELVVDVHDYHESGFTLGNPTPQTDLFTHEHIGGKTLLFLGDGTFGTRQDHKTIAKFLMYPFNNDWTNSLFFSQDPVAIDSVMYDFLFEEGTNPCEGSQNYLHQSAVPNEDTYDPEDDGEYLSESLGVHEHADLDIDIFSADRYSGPSGDGIDYIALGEDSTNPTISFVPRLHYVYFADKEILCWPKMPTSLIFGKITVSAEVNGVVSGIENVEFFVDNELKHTDDDAPYEWLWSDRVFFRHTIKAIAHHSDGNQTSDEIVVWKFF